MTEQEKDIEIDAKKTPPVRIVKEVWDSIKEPTPGRVAKILNNLGWKIGERTVYRHVERGWRESHQGRRPGDSMPVDGERTRKPKSIRKKVQAAVDQLAEHEVAHLKADLAASVATEIGPVDKVLSREEYAKLVQERIDARIAELLQDPNVKLYDAAVKKLLIYQVILIEESTHAVATHVLVPSDAARFILANTEASAKLKPYIVPADAGEIVPAQEPGEWQPGDSAKLIGSSAPVAFNPTISAIADFKRKHGMIAG